MATKNFSVTLPEELFEQIEELREREHQSRSELVGEALRSYIHGSGQGEELHGWQRQVLDQRLAAAKAEPGKGYRFDEAELPHRG